MTPQEWEEALASVRKDICDLQMETRALLQAPLNTCEAFVRLLKDTRRNLQSKSDILDSIRSALGRVENRAMGYSCALRALGANNETLEDIREKCDWLVGNISAIESDIIETSHTTSA